MTDKEKIQYLQSELDKAHKQVGQMQAEISNLYSVQKSLKTNYDGVVKRFFEEASAIISEMIYDREGVYVMDKQTINYTLCKLYFGKGGEFGMGECEHNNLDGKTYLSNPTKVKCSDCGGFIINNELQNKNVIYRGVLEEISKLDMGSKSFPHVNITLEALENDIKTNSYMSLSKVVDEQGVVHATWISKQDHKHVLMYGYSVDNERTWTVVPQKDVDEVVTQILEK